MGEGGEQGRTGNHTPSIVRVAGLAIVGIGRADGVGKRLRGRRIESRILVVVTRGDHDSQARVDSISNGAIESWRVAAPQGHVRNLSANVSATNLHTKGRRVAHRLLNTAIVLGVTNSPLNAQDDAGDAPSAVGAEHLDSDEVALLGHTILCSSDGSGNMGSVAVFVRVWRAPDGVVAPPGAAAKVLFLSLALLINL